MLLNRLERLVIKTKKLGIRETTEHVVDFFGRKILEVLFRQEEVLPISLPNGSKVLFIESLDSYSGGGLGDAIFKLPMLEALSQTSGFPIDIVTDEEKSVIFSGNPNIGKIFYVEKNWLELVYRLRERGYTHIFTLTPSWKMFLLSLLTGHRGSIKRSIFLKNSEVINENHIEMYVKKLRSFVSNLVGGTSVPKLYLNSSNLLERGYFYIGINLGASSALRNFVDWKRVFEKVKLPNNIKIVFVGNREVNGINDKLKDLLGDKVIDFSGILSLEETYSLISECGAFIGPDGGNLNAAFALGIEEIVPIYSIVKGEKRTPIGFNSEEIIQGGCPISDGHCYSENFGTKCVITGQSCLDFSHVPPCMSDEKLVNKITLAIERIISKYGNYDLVA